MSHTPVLLQETLDILGVMSGDNVLDCTFGGGGHTSAILSSCDCRLTAIDRDPDAAIRAQKIKNLYSGRFEFIESRFSEIFEKLPSNTKFDAVLFDYGISSFQVDEADRGFSFQKDGPLDMRMSKDGVSAYDVVNTYPEEDIANIIWTYGDEPKSRRIAEAVVRARKDQKICTTHELRDIVHSCFGVQSFDKRFSKIDVATKTFQAIRIFVNDELREISSTLNNLYKILNNGARIATISFHALEDSIVKDFIRSHKDIYQPINKKVIKASHEEILKNPRSRSAILRGFVYNENSSKSVAGEK